MNANESGAAAEYLAAARFISMGYKVWWPGDQSSRADLLIEKGNDFLKVQCKRAGWVKGKYLRVKTSSNTRKGGIKPYRYGDYDLLAAIDGDRMWLIPYEEVRSHAHEIYLDKRNAKGVQQRDRLSFDAARWLLPQP
jgi:hypothetical protein